MKLKMTSSCGVIFARQTAGRRRIATPYNGKKNENEVVLYSRPIFVMPHAAVDNSEFITYALWLWSAHLLNLRPMIRLPPRMIRIFFPLDSVSLFQD